MRGQLSQTHIPATSPASASAAEHDTISTSTAGTPQTGKSISLGRGLWGVLIGSKAADHLDSQARRPGVVAGIEARPGSADQSFLVHPAVADAAIHAGAALRGQDQTGMMVSVSIGHYGVQRAMHGAPPSSALGHIAINFASPHTMASFAWTPTAFEVGPDQIETFCHSCRDPCVWNLYDICSWVPSAA